MKKLLLFLLLALMSCSKEADLLDYVPAVVIARELGMTQAEPPVDFAYHPANNLLLDTCQAYVQIDTPAFITGVLQFDIMPDTLIWYYRNDPIDFNVVFPNHALYVSGINVSLIVFGTNEYANWQARVWARDGSGAKNYLSFGRGRELSDDRQLFNFLGALTYEQMLELMPQILSAKRFGFFNSGLTCEQAESLIQILKDNCVSGQDKIMDLRHGPCTISAELMDYLVAAGWTIYT